MKHLTITVREDMMSLFYPLLQMGFQLNIRVGCSIHSLLCDQLGVAPDYLRERVKTIFLNQKPVDNVQNALIKDGATLALSAAMPGLVGATFRCGGVLAAFRSTITHQNESAATGPGDGTITLKLFNMLISEMGPLLLEQGITVNWTDLQPVLVEALQSQDPLAISLTLDGRSIDLTQLMATEQMDFPMLIFMKVHTLVQQG
jgi:hypothetical protein